MARERGDWLFIFEAARETHLDMGAEDDLVLRFEKRKQEEDYLSKLKHVSGDFNRWITRFEDQVKVCETIGVVLTEEAKVFYFMNNLNDTIFGTVKANFMELSTRVLFPDTYDEIKQRIISEYGQITSRKPQTVLKVIKGEDAKRYGEARALQRTSILTRKLILTSWRTMEQEKSMKQSEHWRRSKNHFRRSLIQEPWRLERTQTPIVFKSSRTPNATLSMWPWGGESQKLRMWAKWCSIVHSAVPRRTSSAPKIS